MAFPYTTGLAMSATGQVTSVTSLTERALSRTPTPNCHLMAVEKNKNCSNKNLRSKAWNKVYIKTSQHQKTLIILKFKNSHHQLLRRIWMFRLKSSKKRLYLRRRKVSRRATSKIALSMVTRRQRVERTKLADRKILKLTLKKYFKFKRFFKR